jgi:hypothetical protein
VLVMTSSCCGCLAQALGLEVRSVLAIGGIGGLAIGLAGREICENLLNGVLLMTTVRWPLAGAAGQQRPHGHKHDALYISSCSNGLVGIALLDGPHQLKPQQRHWVAC